MAWYINYAKCQRSPLSTPDASTLQTLFPFTMRRFLFPYSALLLLVLTGIACSGASSSFGRYFSGETLVVSAVTMERARELHYSTINSEQVARHYQLTPSEEDLELVLVRLKVENHTATRAIVNMELQAAELRDFFEVRYFSVNVSPREDGGRADQVDDLPGNTSWSVPPGQGFLRGAVELEKGTGLDGWVVFEAPEGTKFRELWWRSGDSIRIQF